MWHLDRLSATLCSVLSSLPAGSRDVQHPEPKRGDFGFTLQCLEDRAEKEWNLRSENGRFTTAQGL